MKEFIQIQTGTMVAKCVGRNVVNGVLQPARHLIAIRGLFGNVPVIGVEPFHSINGTTSTGFDIVTGDEVELQPLIFEVTDSIWVYTIHPDQIIQDSNNNAAFVQFIVETKTGIQ